MTWQAYYFAFFVVQCNSRLGIVEKMRDTCPTAGDLELDSQENRMVAIIPGDPGKHMMSPKRVPRASRLYSDRSFFVQLEIVGFSYYPRCKHP